MVCILNVFIYKQYNIKCKVENESLKKNKLFMVVKKYKFVLFEDILNYCFLKYRLSIYIFN